MSENICVGILSDTHGNVDERIAETVNRCDHIIHAGDIMGADVLDALKPRISLLAVAGNNDHTGSWKHKDNAIVNALAATASIELPGGMVIVEHGHRLGYKLTHDQLRCDYPQARMIVYGHTHKRVIDKNEIPWVVNPGAAGSQRNNGGPSCLILIANESEWKIDEIVFPNTNNADKKSTAC